MTETAGSPRPGDLMIYQGYRLPSEFEHCTDLFLPTAAPLEHQSHYLNFLGQVRSTRIVLNPRKTTYTDSQILRFLRRFAQR